MSNLVVPVVCNQPLLDENRIGPLWGLMFRSKPAFVLLFSLSLFLFPLSLALPFSLQMTNKSALCISYLFCNYMYTYVYYLSFFISFLFSSISLFLSPFLFLPLFLPLSFFLYVDSIPLTLYHFCDYIHSLGLFYF